MARLEAFRGKGTETDAFKDALFGGNSNQGRDIVKWESNGSMYSLSFHR